ncbi:MAG TPA: nuclear transport factor 2 family protein [Nocardioidaceae bacterium]|nr:nuclear transport factor 2 family protein [Nocardioidaceae bacterium]
MADLEERIRRLEDLHAIGQLRAHYCQYLDDGQWDDLVDLFTPDGAFVGLSTARGHDELRTFFPGLLDGPLDAWWHFSSNETIELDGDAAVGVTWLDQPCVVEGRAHIAAGRYTDQMMRGSDGTWRFAERKVTSSSGSPPTPGGRLQPTDGSRRAQQPIAGRSNAAAEASARNRRSRSHIVRVRLPPIRTLWWRWESRPMPEPGSSGQARPRNDASNVNASS